MKTDRVSLLCSNVSRRLVTHPDPKLYLLLDIAPNACHPEGLINHKYDDQDTEDDLFNGGNDRRIDCPMEDIVSDTVEQHWEKQDESRTNKCSVYCAKPSQDNHEQDLERQFNVKGHRL